MINGREFGRVLPFHVLHELLFSVEAHLGVALLLLLQYRVLSAVVVVSRVDEQVFGEGAVGVIERVVLADRVAVGEICAPAGPYKQGVGSKNAAWQHYGDKVLGVSGRVDELDRKVAHLETVAVLEPHVYVARRSLLVHHDLGRCLVFEFPCAGDVIGVRVGVHYVGRLQTMLEDKIEHGLDHLQFGVEDRGRTGVGDYVAQASAVDAELLEEVVLVTLFHVRSSFPAPLYPRQGARRREGILDHSSPPRPENWPRRRSGQQGKKRSLPCWPAVPSGALRYALSFTTLQRSTDSRRGARYSSGVRMPSRKPRAASASSPPSPPCVLQTLSCSPGSRVRS